MAFYEILLGFEEASSASNTGVVYWNMAQGDIPSEWSGDILSITAPGILCNYTEADAIDMIRRWAGMMAPGGELIVTVPDAKEIGKAIAEGVGGVDYTKTLYGNGERKSLWDARIGVGPQVQLVPVHRAAKGRNAVHAHRAGRTATDSTVLDEDGRCKIAGVMGVMVAPPRIHLNQRTMNDISYHCGIPVLASGDSVLGPGPHAGSRTRSSMVHATSSRWTMTRCAILATCSTSCGSWTPPASMRWRRARCGAGSRPCSRTWTRTTRGGSCRATKSQRPRRHFSG